MPFAVNAVKGIILNASIINNLMKNISCFKKLCLFTISSLLFNASYAQLPEPNVPPPASRGVYAIWYYQDTSMLKLPYISGGQIILQWADIERAQGVYDFSAMDKQLKMMHTLGKMTTVQVNGNQKPKWLYAIVPHHPEKLSHQVGDNEGTLMYWHPTFIKAYTDFLKAYADHLKKSPYLSVMVGVRMNFDAFGTEHFIVPDNKRDLSQWIVPPGAQQGIAWTNKIAEDYQTLILDEYINDFKGIKVLLRNNLSDGNVERYRKELDSGKLMFFHTSSEMEPRGLPAEHNYGLFYKFARSGKTLAYAEPWANAWGNHGPITDPRWTGPSQWTYWRMLSDLNFGVSMIAVYTHDLEVAKRGKQTKQGIDTRPYQTEFFKSFKFAAYYAGYHASPEVAPGAWVAFRHSEKNLMTKNILKEFTGNYTYLMQEVHRDEGHGNNLINVGDNSQRFGAWARSILQDNSVRLALSNLFAASLKGKQAVIRIIYFDDKKGSSFETIFGNTKLKTVLQGTSKWQTLEIPVAKANFLKDNAGADITITAKNGDIILHMINVERGSGKPHDVINAKRSVKGEGLSWNNPVDYDIAYVDIYSDNKLIASLPPYNQQFKLDNKKGKSKLIIKTVDESGRESTGVIVK